MVEAGYSGTPLARKLGLKPGQRTLAVGVPHDLLPALAEMGRGGTRRDLADLRALDAAPGPYDVVHVFVVARAALAPALPALRARIDPAGMIWVSWPKKASRRPTDVTEDVVRALALGCGLVDVKVCAVDAVWSGLKLMIPRALRP